MTYQLIKSKDRKDKIISKRFVSWLYSQTNTMHMAQKLPQTKKTLDCILACCGSTMYGVAYAMPQLSSLGGQI